MSFSTFSAKWPVAVKCATQEAQRIVSDKKADPIEKKRAQVAVKPLTDVLKKQKPEAQCSDTEKQLVRAFYFKSLEPHE